MQKVIADVVKKIRSLKQEDKTLFVAIDGRGGSGKSTLADNLARQLADTTIVHLDDFAYPMQGADRQRLLDQVIVPLRKNVEARYQRFDMKVNKLAEWHTIAPGGIVLIEGVLVLHPMLHEYYDFRIWIECPAEQGFKRGVARDIGRDGTDNSKQWQEVWMPEEKRAIEEHTPHTKADYILDGTQKLM